MTSNDITQAIEDDIRNAKAIVEMDAALQRLKANRDFQTIINKGYFEQEAIRLVHLKSNPSMQTPDAQKAILLQIDSIGSLSSYFQVINSKANMAVRTIDDCTQQLTEIYAEEIE